MINWDKEFKEAIRCAMGYIPTLKISNKKPPHETARNIFREDEDRIMQTAAENGFVILSKTPHSVDFILK